ncbi:MAG TPA: NUDIX hydrolase [Deltaproteobacteria bacterium]|nr:NUDIX hydrolase [Deltaproteobacteria bacterium]HQB38357.1 NUDIX hydrolase [Deltaproteobacteria bacterium]
MSFSSLDCPKCGATVRQYHNPIPTVDIIIEMKSGIVLVRRKNPPCGWALPGGFVDYGESLEAAAVREAQEETFLAISELRLVGCYSDPSRDARLHTISTVFAAKGAGTPAAGDDAAELSLFPPDQIPHLLCFDHAIIIADYQRKKESGLI